MQGATKPHSSQYSTKLAKPTQCVCHCQCPTLHQKTRFPCARHMHRKAAKRGAHALKILSIITKVNPQRSGCQMHARRGTPATCTCLYVFLHHLPAHQYLKHRTCNLRADSPPRAGTGPTPTVIAQIDRDAGAAGKISCAFNISITQLPSRNLAASRITVLHVHRSASVMPSGPRFKNTASPAASTLEGLTHNGMQLAEFVQPHTTENSWI
jgi:hypothetical protein